MFWIFHHQHQPPPWTHNYTSLVSKDTLLATYCSSELDLFCTELEMKVLDWNDRFTIYLFEMILLLLLLFLLLLLSVFLFTSTSTTTTPFSAYASVCVWWWCGGGENIILRKVYPLTHCFVYILMIYSSTSSDTHT